MPDWEEMMEFRVSTSIDALGTCSERYVPDGYFEELGVDERLELISKMDGVSGLQVFYPSAPLPEDPDKLVKKVKDFGLTVADLYIESAGHRKWRHGAYSSSEVKTRKEAVKLFKEGIDFAKAINANSALLWPAHDGFDYPFQTDYRDAWKYLVETIREIGEYDKNVKVAVEYKEKDPRQKQFVSNAGKQMMLLNDVGLENVGFALDTGHALLAGENLAETLVIIDSHKKLIEIHLDDNYKDADPDMMFGTINFWETLEFFYYLNKTNFEGWCDIYIVSPRDDRAKALEMSVNLAHKYKKLADRISIHAQEIDSNLKGYRFTDNIKIISDIVFP
jgi:sugar phosphate isomerase/epimerase